MNTPTFFIAGNSKSGTTALYHFLKAHPAIFMCEPKEPNHFATDFCRDPNPSGYFHPRTEAAYLALFKDARPDQRCGEASACYLYSSVAAKKIHAFNPEARIIFMLREPVDFLHSYHLQLLKNDIAEGEEVKDFEAALALEPTRRQGQHLPDGCFVPEFLFYSERIKYAEQLERFYQYFDRSQVLVLIYDEFKRDNEQSYRQVLSFIEVDPSFSPSFSTYNKGSTLRSRRLQQLVRNVTFGEGWAAPLKAVLKRSLPQKVRRGLVHEINQKVVFKPKTALNPEIVTSLKASFREEVDKVGTLLGRDLITLWGYDQLAS